MHRTIASSIIAGDAALSLQQNAFFFQSDLKRWSLIHHNAAAQVIFIQNQSKN
jgi:hypothetical protein